MFTSVKRLVATVIGGTILVIGLALLVLPGPAFIVIPIGLAILGTEYVWARRWLKRARNMVNPRKAKRTGRALRQVFSRRWEAWRAGFARWSRRWLPWRRQANAPTQGQVPGLASATTPADEAPDAHRDAEAVGGPSSQESFPGRAGGPSAAGPVHDGNT